MATLEENKTLYETKNNELKEAIDNGNLEKANQLMEEVKQLKSDIEKEEAEQKMEAEEENKEEQQEETSEETTGVTKKTEVKEETKIVEQSKQEEGDKRSMTNSNLIEEVVLNDHQKQNTAVADYRHFLITGEKRAGIKTTDAGILVPPEVVTSIEKFTEDLDSLEDLVTVKNVTHLSGTYPVRNDDTALAPLPTVAELEESPELGLRKLGNQEYKIETHRGLIKASWESLDDGVEVESIINEEVAEAIVATKNKKILDALAPLEAKSVTTLDGLKTIINTGIKKRYKKQIVLSDDVYDIIDKMKDSQGNYLLQPSITSESGTKLFGLDVKLYDKELIGTNTMYIGSLKDAAILFKRKELYVNYEIWNQYGKVFTPIIRIDAHVKNPKAVVKVTFSPAV
ncbi:phage major capsid protein [Macrococcus capreoli]|uniref:phage major capsid protein n=1 Tax=Macrococcus capreoli TaxID=2982690 RepID=UPI0021D5ADF2|nr:phage major capsid protein [Macrococcus sp. TMW 2.2395]MCU7557261.1 phage major capsid protein [Macrococcus sp. TMW 2.2395]